MSYVSMLNVDSSVPGFDQAKRRHAKLIISLVKDYYEKQQREGNNVTLDHCLKAVDVTFDEFSWAEQYIGIL